MRRFLGPVGPLMLALALVGATAACATDGAGGDSGAASGGSGVQTSLASSSSSDSAGGGLPSTVSPTVAVGRADPQPRRGTIEIVRTLEHDPALFTQGLQVVGDEIYESTGQYGSSQVQRRPLGGGPVTASVPMADNEFGEGLAVTADALWTVTWKNGVAHKRDPQTLEVIEEKRYEGEGWGLCFDGTRLVMSNGSDRLTFRDPVTFEPTGSVAVTAGGTPVPWINELECVDGAVLANVFLTDEIIRIDPATGVVTDIYDGAQLQQPRPGSSDAVLNGIAALPGSENLLVTGKLWPTMYEVRLGA